MGSQVDIGLENYDNTIHHLEIGLIYFYETSEQKIRNLSIPFLLQMPSNDDKCKTSSY
jgi:hypothetical protein